MEKKVGIVMVNYREYAERFLEAAVASLRIQSYPAAAISFYLVDNASTPASRDHLASVFPEAKIIERPDGNYCAANNAGARAAIADGCKYLVFCNMDTVFAPSWLKELVKPLEENKEIGVAQSKIFLYQADDRSREGEKINSLGNIVHFLGFGFTRGNGQEAGQYDTFLQKAGPYPEIGYASGCSLIIRTDLFQSIGGYDEQYYMYHDDIELSFKTKLAGYRTVLAPKSILWHKYEFSRSVKMLYYMERNRHLFLFSFFPFRFILLLIPALLVIDLGVSAYAIKNGWAGGIGRLIGYFCRLSTWTGIKAKRRQLRQLAGSRGWKKMGEGLVGRIDFQEIDNPLLRLANPVLDIYWRLIRGVL